MTDKETNKSLPCPFCGNGAQAEYVPRKQESLFSTPWQVRCFTCGARGPRKPTQHLAENKWNIRFKQD